jgi:hypothetical protein
MSAADAREELEAALWRALKLGGWNKAVDSILAVADEYALACSAEAVASALDDRARNRRLAAAEASAADHREQIGEAPGPAPRWCACGAEIPPHPGRGPKPALCHACRAERRRAYARSYWRGRRKARKKRGPACPDCGARKPDHLITCGTVLGRPA